MKPPSYLGIGGCSTRVLDAWSIRQFTAMRLARLAHITASADSRTARAMFARAQSGDCAIRMGPGSSVLSA